MLTVFALIVVLLLFVIARRLGKILKLLFLILNAAALIGMAQRDGDE